MTKQKKIASASKKPRNVGVTIRDKDQKLLWSRSAGRCSLEECRQLLTMDINDGKSATLGEMCHIVGEKLDAARGKSNLSLADRNLYSNLILLCAHHHKIIDRYEIKYSIELLHKIKIQHELWVDETLSAKKLLPDDLVYSSIIDYLAISLKLDQWNWFIENSVRQLLHRDFIDAADLVAERQLAVIWPGTKPELEAAIKNLMQSYLDYIWHYISFAIPRQGGESYAADTTYKQVYPNPHYDFYSDKHDLWARKNFIMLCLYTAHLNEFAKAVRKYSNPHFYIVKGKFLVVDSLGTHLGSWGSMLDPNISNLQESLGQIENECIKFQKKHKGKEPISARKLTL